MKHTLRFPFPAWLLACAVLAGCGAPEDPAAPAVPETVDPAELEAVQNHLQSLALFTTD